MVHDQSKRFTVVIRKHSRTCSELSDHCHDSEKVVRRIINRKFVKYCSCVLVNEFLIFQIPNLFHSVILVALQSYQEPSPGIECRFSPESGPVYLFCLDVPVRKKQDFFSAQTFALKKNKIT